MVIPIVFAAVLTLLTTSSEKPLCCYATERGWIVYALGSPDLHILRPHIHEAFTERIVLTSSTLTPSNLVDHKLSALVIDDRLIVEYNKDLNDGMFPARLNDNDPRCRGECSTKYLFDGKVADRNGRSSNLVEKVVNQTITGDLFTNSKKEIFAVNCYDAVDKTRVLGWYKDGNLKKYEIPSELFKIACPFKGHFKVFHAGDRYFFVTDRGVLYSCSVDKDGRPLAVAPVFLGFGEPITAVVSIVKSNKVIVFTRHRYFELGNTIPTPKQLWDSKFFAFSKPRWIANELPVRTNILYFRLVQDNVIELIKLDAK